MIEPAIYNNRSATRINLRAGYARRGGAALLVVLFIVMVGTVLALGFLSQSDVELACGRNMLLRTQMDYLAQSALEHARALVLNPQDVDGEYWSGAQRQQLVAGSDCYYDVQVAKLGPCNYSITCETYKEKDGARIARSGLEAELRLDPCIAIMTGTEWTTEPLTTINGDVSCGGNLRQYDSGADINGDVFANGYISATNIEGHKNQCSAETLVTPPQINVADFQPVYYIGSTSYSPYFIDANVHSEGTFVPSPGNPAGIRYYDGDLVLPGNVDITGTLVVDGDLTIRGADNSIAAVKNLPALLVAGELIMQAGATLSVTGLVQITRRVNVTGPGASLNVTGCLVLVNGSIDGAYENSATINVTASADDAAIEVWPSAGNSVRWSPALGAFFKKVHRGS